MAGARPPRDCDVRVDLWYGWYDAVLAGVGLRLDLRRSVPSDHPLSNEERPGVAGAADAGWAHVRTGRHIPFGKVDDEGVSERLIHERDAAIVGGRYRRAHRSA